MSRHTQGEGVRNNVTKYHMGEGGSKIGQKCHVLFEWPLIRDTLGGLYQCHQMSHGVGGSKIVQKVSRII